MRMMTALVTCWVGVCGLAFTTGCGATTYRMPDVGEHDVTSILELKNGPFAVLSVDGWLPRPPLTTKRFLLLGLGGHLVSTQLINKVEILAGDHELELSFSAPGKPGDTVWEPAGPLVLKFTALSGRIYRVNGFYTISTASGKDDLYVTFRADGSVHSMQVQKEPATPMLISFVEDITDSTPRIVSKSLDAKHRNSRAVDKPAANEYEQPTKTKTKPPQRTRMSLAEAIARLIVLDNTGRLVQLIRYGPIDESNVSVEVDWIGSLNNKYARIEVASDKRSLGRNPTRTEP